MMTAHGKITAAKLTPTARILVQRTETDGQVGVALRKTGDDILAATVTAVEPVRHGRTTGRKITTAGRGRHRVRRTHVHGRPPRSP